MWQTAEVIVRDRAIFEGMSRCRESTEVAAAKEELDALTGELVRRAQAQGALRRDIDASDVLALIGAAILGATQRSDGDAWRRYVTVVFDGLRIAV